VPALLPSFVAIVALAALMAGMDARNAAYNSCSSAKLTGLCRPR
jgi:hypothetical protein